MICRICKDRVASIRLKEIINDVVTEFNLCQTCYDAREQEGTGVSDSLAADVVSSFAMIGGKEDAEPAACPACATSKVDLREKGRLGCSECYGAFSVSLEPILSRAHGSTEHRGKVPQRAAMNLDLKNELRRLQEDLREAIVSENYEQAARLRDKIIHYESM